MPWIVFNICFFSIVCVYHVTDRLRPLLPRGCRHESFPHKAISCNHWHTRAQLPITLRINCCSLLNTPPAMRLHKCIRICVWCMDEELACWIIIHISQQVDSVPSPAPFFRVVAAMKRFYTKQYLSLNIFSCIMNSLEAIFRHLHKYCIYADDGKLLLKRSKYKKKMLIIKQYLAIGRPRPLLPRGCRYEALLYEAISCLFNNSSCLKKPWCL